MCSLIYNYGYLAKFHGVEAAKQKFFLNYYFSSFIVMPARKRSKPALVHASPSECFWTSNGFVLPDLKSLEGALLDMSDDTYSYHVNKKRNDFAVWDEEVLHDKACVAALRRANTR